MAILAIGAGLLMTTLAVVIAGFVLELILFALGRALSTLPEPKPVVVHLKPVEKATGTLEWAEEAAA